MKRLPDWQERLVSYFVQVRKQELVLDWADFSCAKFVCGAIEAITGTDLHAPFDGKYTTAFEAAKALKSFGYSSLLEYVQGQVSEISPVMAQYGDVVSVSVGGAEELPEAVRYTLGIAEPPYYWVITEQGLGRGLLLSDQVHQAFSIGY